MMFGGPKVPTLSLSELSQDAFVVDVREDDEWQAGHSPTAVHAAMSLQGEILNRLPADGQIVVICKSGGRSAQVTQWLVDQGRDAVNLDGGMMGWEAAGRPVVTDSGEPGFVL
ncbi:unannotated protein [freshwater metagenome]|uniref:Unannotated protein n=1 Tax=freshwater metagenome TaxID=449393 RepID=A0A6J7D6E4_9ZZZZ